MDRAPSAFFTFAALLFALYGYPLKALRFAFPFIGPLRHHASMCAREDIIIFLGFLTLVFS
ncbi:hypothetical protein P152DRAFT_150821 [Eremomyces bilateralis CBS 781.70]|uniref:Uncharacterized protein n=1 Tax=Eremomyces bilateralis CBS 781.70 TaxID=1392243 RepID=A0A6G1FVW3_9PEZI|nr:uncharacterized protein P152DRAFT_150821 [Eremomyces bilateralis CBS 781.70]KAF1809811.1 hypothetical protein P152DRAFT_150821 [Eremomyces bilateralis CBS 781.70]